MESRRPTETRWIMIPNMTHISLKQQGVYFYTIYYILFISLKWRFKKV